MEMEKNIYIYILTVNLRFIHLVRIDIASSPLELNVAWCIEKNITTHISLHSACLVGFVIYFGYGIRNSVEGIPKQDTNDNDFILQGTPDFAQDVQKVQPGNGATDDKVPLEASFSEPS